MTYLPLVAAIIAFAAVALLFYSVYSMATAERQIVVDRLRRHGGGTAAVADGASGSISAGATILVDRDYSSIETFDRALKRSGLAERIALDLARAGVPLRVGEYLLIRWLVAAAVVVLAYSVFNLVPLVSLALGVLGFYIPRFYVSRKEASRIGRFNDQIVDALTMMANSLKSGSSFLQAIDMVARELPAPISQEFARVVAEANVGASVENSLLDLSQRVRSYDLYLIVTAMLVQREIGGNLSEVLENIAHTIRERQELLRQVRVETAEQRFSGYIVGAMPIFVVFMLLSINPDYPNELLQSSLGQIILVAAAIMEILGFYIIQRLVDIEV